jgi:hypothetical protein
MTARNFVVVDSTDRIVTITSDESSAMHAAEWHARDYKLTTTVRRIWNGSRISPAIHATFKA